MELNYIFKEMGCLKLSYYEEEGVLEKSPLKIFSCIEEKNDSSIFCIDYSPFGLTFNSYTRSYSTAQNYKYNGKELQEETNWYDYGARMYQPDLGRWFAIDPLAQEYAPLSPYSYAASNPVNIIDPDGRKLKPVNQKREFRAALRYLRNSETARGVIKFLRKHDEVINVGSYAPHLPSYYSSENLYHSKSKTVSWNAYRGMKTTDGFNQSSALGLAHELVHAYLDLTGQSDDTPDSQYDTQEEKEVIENYETKIADELLTGESTRTDHGGNHIWTTGPTSRTETNDGKAPEGSKSITGGVHRAIVNYLTKDMTKEERKEYRKKANEAYREYKKRN